MSSLSRFPRVVLACALAALAAGGLLLLLNATDGPAAAGPAGLAPLAPTQFPPAGRDCFEVEAHLLVAILGICDDVRPYRERRFGFRKSKRDLHEDAFHIDKDSAFRVDLVPQVNPPWGTHAVGPAQHAVGVDADRLFFAFDLSDLALARVQRKLPFRLTVME